MQCFPNLVFGYGIKTTGSCGPCSPKRKDRPNKKKDTGLVVLSANSAESAPCHLLQGHRLKRTGWHPRPRWCLLHRLAHERLLLAWFHLCQSPRPKWRPKTSSKRLCAGSQGLPLHFPWPLWHESSPEGSPAFASLRSSKALVWTGACWHASCSRLSPLRCFARCHWS